MPKSFPVALLDVDIERIKWIRSQDEGMWDLMPSNRSIVAYALKQLVLSIKNPVRPATSEDVAVLGAKIDDALLKISQAPVSRGVGRPPKLSDEEKIEETKNICQLLDGKEVGGSCVYNKYEITSTGKALSYEVAVPLEQLTPILVEKQFDPNKEAWLSAHNSQM